MKQIAFPFLCAATMLILHIQNIGAQNVSQELPQKFATVKENVARNQAALQQYTWTEYVQVSLKGEVKNTKVQQCRYGPDGQIQKTELQASPQSEKHGLRGKIAEHKKHELQDYMERASALIHNYVPPSAERMQQAFQAGNASVGMSGPGMIQLQFKDYLKPGDMMTIRFDPATKAVRALTVNSYLDDPKDIVTLHVDFQKLPDGTNHPATTILDAPAKNLQVKTENTNYQRIAG
jgi:hypothetical protein